MNFLKQTIQQLSYFNFHTKLKLNLINRMINLLTRFHTTIIIRENVQITRSIIDLNFNHKIAKRR